MSDSNNQTSPYASGKRKGGLLEKSETYNCFDIIFDSFFNKEFCNTGHFYIQSTKSSNLPNSRINNYSIGINGNIAISFYGKEIMIFKPTGELINHIFVKDSEPFFIIYQENTEYLDLYFSRDNLCVTISENGEIKEQKNYDQQDIDEKYHVSKRYTKKYEDYTYQMKSSFKFPITTCRSKLIQVNEKTKEERVIYDNPFVSVMESIGLTLVILVFGTVIFVMISKITGFFVRIIRNMLKGN